MKALPSIAFNDFSGTAGDVTARFVKGRTILTVRPFPNKVVSGSQKDNRNALSRISRAFKKLTDTQMAEWAELAKHLKTASILGITAEMTAHNAFVRLNSNRVMAGESILTDAPSSHSSIPLVEYENLFVTPDLVALTGIRHQHSPYKLVIKMSTSQSNGISNGWGKTIIITGDMVSRSKPAPDPYLKGIAFSGCQADECIVVEDSPAGVKAAKDAGIFTIGFKAASIRLDTSLADIEIGSYKELEGYLEGLAR